MKKLAYLLVVVALVMGFAACSDQSGEAGSDFVWEKTGVFADGNDNYLMISASDNEDYDGMWAVTAMLGDEVHGWFIAQEGETLHGNLNSEYDDYEGDFIVTISEDGDGVKMEVEGGETYHFTTDETPEVIATLKINVEGLGFLAYGLEGEKVEFDEEFPNQSIVVNLTEPRTYVIKAQPGEGYKFVKWTKDGEDFSEKPEITVEVGEDVEYIAVFEAE